MEYVQNFVQVAVLPTVASAGNQGSSLGVSTAAVAGQPSLAGRWVQLEGGGANAMQAGRRLHTAFQALGREPRRMPVGEFRTNLADVIAWSIETERPVIVTSHGRPLAVLLSFGLFRRTLMALAREVLNLRRRRSALATEAEDLLADEAAALNARLRGRV